MQGSRPQSACILNRYHRRLYALLCQDHTAEITPPGQLRIS
nr:MAG TPA_asm: hypothetical protein [Caudoviricetes sp.]